MSSNDPLSNPPGFRGWLLFLFALFLVIPPLQHYFKNRFAMEAIELPYLTQFALGWFPTLQLMFMLAATYVIGVAGSPVTRARWELVIAVLTGVLIGYLTISIGLAFPVGPRELSFVDKSEQSENQMRI